MVGVALMVAAAIGFQVEGVAGVVVVLIEETIGFPIEEEVAVVRDGESRLLMNKYHEENIQYRSLPKKISWPSIGFFFFFYCFQPVF